MRKLFSLLVIVIWSCKSESQNLNNETVQQTKKSYLLGKINKDDLTSGSDKEWFLSNFNEYQPNEQVLHKISKKLKQYDILLFMGTWCGDSRREVPRLYKILETVNYPMNQLQVVALSREPNMYKQSPGHEEEGLNIHRVPTIIVYKKGKEVSRIVEHPVASLEKDMLRIINNTYTPNYHIVTEVNNLLGTPDFYDKAIDELPRLKSLSKNMYELNTYARILASKNRTDDAIAVLKLNTKLFPDQPRTFMSLANTLGAHGYKEEAVKILDEALKIHPDNKNLKNNLIAIKSN